MDSSGNVTVAGAFQGSINLGGTTLVSKGDGDIFVAQYKSTGQHLWSKSFGGTKYDAVRAVAVDSSGNITVTGEFSTTVNFGGSTLTTKGSYDIFLAQFKSTGQHLWSKAFGSINAEYARAVAVDSSGNIALTGSFFSSVNFGGTALISKGSQDVFLALFKSGGQHIWSKAFGGISYDDSFGLAVGNSGDVTVTGVFQKTMNLGGSNMTSKGGYDVFLAQFKASNGQHLWSKAFGGASHDYGRALALDGSGNLTLTGSYVGSASFGGATLAAKGSNDMFLAQYKASNGQHIWSKALGGSGNDQPMAMAVDGSGNLTVTGYFTNSGNFGGQTLTSKGSWEIFLARYKSTGQHIWSRAIGGIGGDYAYAVAVDKSSNSILFGRISEVVDFGLGAVTSFGTMFAAQYAP